MKIFEVNLWDTKFVKFRNHPFCPDYKTFTKKHLWIKHSFPYHEVNVPLLTAKVIHQSLKAMLFFTNLKQKRFTEKQYTVCERFVKEKLLCSHYPRDSIGMLLSIASTVYHVQVSFIIFNLSLY